MANVEFGTTWWGKSWLGALKNIDYSNRLTRGKAYAQNEAVVSIDINGNRIAAKVQGRKVVPYLVSLKFPTFDQYEKGEIYDLVQANPYFISKLESKNLPPTLYDKINEEMIDLFPKSWRTIQMKCNCEDDGVPCKHVSAVIYLLANEIDKNPFLIFNLHGFNLLKVIKPQDGRRKETQSIPGITDYIAESPVKASINQEDANIYKEIDFSTIPDLLDTINKLLTPNPLFFSVGNFKKKLTSQYRAMRRVINRYIKETEINEHPEIKFKRISIKIKNTSLDFMGKLSGSGDPLIFSLEDMDTFIGHLHQHTLSDIKHYPAEMAFLAQVYSFVLKLIQKSAYIPDIFSIDEDEYMIRWIPALFDQQIKTIADQLVSSMPADFLFYGNKPLKKRDQLNFLVSFIISYFQKHFDVCPKRDETNILYLFFNFDVYTKIKFEDRQIPEIIHLWLSRFFIASKNYTPVIKIDEAPQYSDRFYFQILIKDRATSATNPLLLNKFLALGSDENNQVLKDLALLSDYLPQINDYLNLSDNRTRLTIPSQTFVEIWFEALPLLHTLGIKTILPKSLKKVFIPELSLTFTPDEKADFRRTSFLNLKSMLDFKWNIAIGDRFLKVSEFEKLIEKYKGIIKYKDTYFHIDKNAINKILRQLQKPPQLSTTDIIRINLTGKYKGTPIKTDKSLQSIFTRILAKHDPDLPEKLQANLREYQVQGFKWLYNNFKAGFGALIADDMGLGKTLQVITLLLKLKEEEILGPRKSLIVVPATLLTNWQHEINKFAPSLTPFIYHGQNRRLNLDNTDIVITTYSLVRNEKKVFAKHQWLVLISDETQNIKNPASHQTKALKSIPADIKIAMTGTPVENRLMDYWSIMDYTIKGLLGKRTQFKEDFATPIERFRDHSRLEDFRKITNPFILRREKTDKSIINDLPDKLEIEEYNPLTHQQAALYQRVLDQISESMRNSKGINRKGLIFKLITSLKQICNHPVHYTKADHPKIAQSGKTSLLADLLKKIIDINGKTLIFTQYKQMGDLLVQMLPDVLQTTPLFLHGGLTRRKRDQLINQFQQESHFPLMILSLRAGGTGLNLTAANHVIHYDLWWNPAVENQATDRAFRIGQKRDVTVYRLITQGTFEEKINDMLHEKKELAKLTVQAGEKWITELSDKELQALFKLERRV